MSFTFLLIFVLCTLASFYLQVASYSWCKIKGSCVHKFYSQSLYLKTERESNKKSLHRKPRLESENPLEEIKCGNIQAS